MKTLLTLFAATPLLAFGQATIADNNLFNKLNITNGTAVNLSGTLANVTVSGTNDIGSLTEFDGRVLMERTGLLNDFPYTTLLVGNSSPAAETEAVRAYRTISLTNDIAGQFSSGYFAWHMDLDGHSSDGQIFALNGSWLHEGTNGGVNYVTGVNSAGYLDTDSYNQGITNAYNFRGSINNNSTGGSVFIAPRNFYGGFGGAGTFGNPVNIELPDTTVTFTNTAEALRLGMLAGAGKYNIRQTGTATNRWDGPHEFNARTHWGSGAQIYTDTGTASDPALLIDDTDSGFYRNSANAIAVSVGGTSLLWFGTSGIRFSTDNAYDIGANGGNRPRDIYSARDIIGGGDVYVGSGGQLRFGTQGRFGPSTDGEDTLLNNAGTANASLRFRYYQQSKTADYTVTATESGSMFHNGSASGTVIFTLPSSHTGGAFYTFQVRAAQSLVIAATNSATITFRGSSGSANGYISSATVGSTITLVSNGTSWLAIADEGTWSVGGASSTAPVYTLGNPQLTTIELGHSSANTLTASGGVLSVEGNAVPSPASPSTGSVPVWTNSAWAALPIVASSALSPPSVEYMTHFMQRADGGTQYPDIYFPSTGGSGGGANLGTVADLLSHPGICRLNNTTVGSYAIASTALDAIRFSGGEYEVEFCIYLPNLSDGTDTFTVAIGFIDGLNADSTDGAWVKYSHGVNSGKFQAIAVNNTTATTSDLGVTVAATTWYRIKITVNADGTSVTYTVMNNSGSTLGTTTITTNIPTGSSRQTGAGVAMWKSVGTTARYTYIDWARIKLQPTP